MVTTKPGFGRRAMKDDILGITKGITEGIDTSQLYRIGANWG